MKIQKQVKTLILAALLVAMFCVPALAANYDLPVPPTAFEQDGKFSCWELGEDTREQFLTATALVLEMPEPAFEKMVIVIQGEKNSWVQKEFEDPKALWKDGKIVIDFAANGIVPADIQETGEKSWLKVLAGNWDPHPAYGDWGVTKAYLVMTGSSDQTPGGPAVSAPNAKTGVEQSLLIAVLVLALSSAGAFFFRKARKV